MSNFTLSSISSAEYDSAGNIVFIIDGLIDGVSFTDLRHLYRANKKDATNLACETWLETNTPTAYSEPDYVTEALVREKRNALLAETDWWAVSDRTMTQAQTDYRQALRDITSDDDFPNMTWPTKPD